MDMVASPTARAVRRIEAVRALRQVQFPEDAGAMAHPVRPDSYVEINNFYTPTIYEKGAEVVRMMQSLVGRAGFERGITLYFQRHDGQAVTCDDFAQAIADANPGSELAQRLPQFKRWYGQAGTPRLVARGPLRRAVAHYTLGLEQSPAPSAAGAAREPFVIPLGDRPADADGREMKLRLEDEPEAAAATSRMLVLDDTKAFFTFVDVDEPPVPSLLRGFSAPVCCRRRPRRTPSSAILLRHDSDPFNRWEAGQRLACTASSAAVAGAVDAPARRLLRRRDACGAARSGGRPGVQGAGADAAERDLHRRAARERRSAARPCGARGDEAAARGRARRRLAMGVRRRTR
jgi:aminopeptidase N